MLIDLNELGKKLNAYKTLVKSQEGQISTLREQVAAGREAVATLQSERDANAVLTAEIADLKYELEHTRQWYAVRLERLWHWAHANLTDKLKSEYFSIVANGTISADEPPSYALQMNVLGHQVAALKKQLANRPA